MIRVFVVDDSAFVRKALRKVLSADPDVTVVGEAASGPEAVLRIPEAAPDVVTLDVEMQGLDGLQVLRQLLAWNPGLHVIMLSALTQAGAEATVEALAIGAADFIDKQSLNLMDLERLGREIGERLRALRRRVPLPRAAPVRAEEQAPDLSGPELCVIGASTGGPAALQHLLEQLPVDFPLPVAIVQHMPPGFTRLLAGHLAAIGPTPCVEAEDGMPVLPGTAYVAPGDRHLRVRREGAGLCAALSQDPPVNYCRPAVDPLFASAREALPGAVLAAVLTGMGQDGLAGARAVIAGGGQVVAQDEASSVVWGMPGAAAQAGICSALLPIDKVAGEIMRIAGVRP